MSSKNHMKSKNSNCKCRCQNDNCNIGPELNPNTYLPEDALENLKVLDSVYNRMKKSFVHYLSDVTALYMNLAEAQNPNKLVLVENLKRFNLLQQSLLNEIKTTNETKFTDLSNAVPTIISTSSIEYFSKKGGSTPKDYFDKLKNLNSRRLFVKFQDDTKIEFLTVPSFIFNLDGGNDALTVQISEYSSYLLSTNNFFRNADTKISFFINADTNDGYLYKDSNGVYYPDRKDAYNFEDNIKDSVQSVLEFYESIINLGDLNDIELENGDTVAGTDIHLILNTLDLNLKRVELAKRMICLRTNQ